MNQLIIVFEFESETPEKISAFWEIIQKYGMYAFVTQRTCLIWTDNTAANVRDNLKRNLSTGDKLYVGNTSAPAAWLTSVNQSVTDYIQKNLK